LSPSDRTLGVAGTLFLHLLLFQSTIFGSGAPRFRPPDIQGLGASSLKTGNPPSETIVLLDLPSVLKSDETVAEELASLGPVLKATSIALLSPDPLPHVDIPLATLDDAMPDVAVDSGDPIARAALFGRYTGQIDARIERAWRRPRSPVNDKSAALRDARTEHEHGVATEDIFKCQVRILQDEQGVVREVQMLSCRGSIAWQQSLVSAIFPVSPLPAPPSPTVFTKAVIMTLTALPYTQGSAADGYEIEGTAEVRTYPQFNPAAPIFSRSANRAGILFAHPRISGLLESRVPCAEPMQQPKRLSIR